MGLCVTGQPDNRRGGGCALDGGGQAVHICPAGRDDLGGGLGFDGLGGGLFRLGFVLLGQLVFQFGDLVRCPVQIAAQRGGFFLRLGQLGAELVGLAGFGVVPVGLGEKGTNGADGFGFGLNGHDHGERFIVAIGDGGGDRGRGAELGGGVQRGDEFCVVDRGEIGGGVVVADGGGLGGLHGQRGALEGLRVGVGFQRVGVQPDEIELVCVVLVLAVLVKRPVARLAAGEALHGGGVLRRVHGAEKKAVAYVDRAVLGDLADEARRAFQGLGGGGGVASCEFHLVFLLILFLGFASGAGLLCAVQPC